MDKETAVKLSVIIPAYNRHALTARHVEECVNSLRTPDEIIVVNDGGPRDLEGMLRSLKSFPEKRIGYAYIEQDIPWNYNGACNLGVWLSTGDILAIEDTDHIPDRTLYEKALQMFAADPELERLAVKRKVVNETEVFSKPLEEWVHHKIWGVNQMVAFLRRDVYLLAKGQDERFSGEYGWMTYDWVNRTQHVRKIKSESTEFYYAVVGDGGEPGLSRSMSPRNHRFYRENAVKEHSQHPQGILNFTFTFSWIT